MTEPNNTGTDAAELESMKFPTRPRFTLDDLREIRIAGGDGESTVAAYCFDHNGEPAEKVVSMDDLTHAEREAALAFILAHGQAAAIRRKKQQKPRKARRSPRLYNTEAVAFEPVDLDDLKPPSLPEIDTPDEQVFLDLDPEPLNRILEGNEEEKGSPKE